MKFIMCHSSRPTIPKFMNEFKWGIQLQYLPFVQVHEKKKAIQMEALSRLSLHGFRGGIRNGGPGEQYS